MTAGPLASVILSCFAVSTPSMRTDMPSLTLARYADPSGDAFETMRKAGRALGLPVTLVIDKDGCEVAAVEGGAKWDSAEAQALVEALKGG
jgi:uncharacterized membrane protein YdfJ with MMPL/SSD domain